ncbi:hypothetical protein HY484_03195, partial [Candidatus Woesearchaeota archaeon]|nr:hypothetical protein [Candidatus Woesearchaeota archaeon]
KPIKTATSQATGIALRADQRNITINKKTKITGKKANITRVDDIKQIKIKQV